MSAIERLRKLAESADRGEGVSLAGMARHERRRLLAGLPTPDRTRNGHDRETGHGAQHESGLPEGSSKP